LRMAVARSALAPRQRILPVRASVDTGCMVRLASWRRPSIGRPSITLRCHESASHSVLSNDPPGLSAAIERALKADVVVVAAAGQPTRDSSVTYPAALLPGVLPRRVSTRDGKARSSLGDGTGGRAGGTGRRYLHTAPEHGYVTSSGRVMLRRSLRGRRRWCAPSIPT
jgi:hypothetical protein